MQPTTLCNLDCRYCYLPHRARRLTMSREVAMATARSVNQWARDRDVDVVWHGGEPLATGRALLGDLMDCFNGERLSHSVQTNATLIDERWCEFFLRRGVRVGVSLDGPAQDNLARTDRRGQPAFARIVRGIQLLTEAGLELSVIAVVSDPTPERARRLYRVVADLGCRWLGVNIEEEEGVNRRTNAYPLQQVRAFWAALADSWQADRRVQLRDVDNVLAYATKALGEPSDSLPEAVIDPLPTIGHDGDVTLISPELAGFVSARLGPFACGNVTTRTLDQLIHDGLNASWAQEYFRGVSRCRAECPYFGFCGGGPPANRYFEQARLDGSETNYCRNSKIALMEGVLDHAEALS
ncbi:cyclophane-forming radical SAM peptide maturase AmcB [Amycolatopsis magusensis]|uniref:cyclophane-forming radical SAM peptide maturase AmcB n=1 Tax=Amycolatopsis magusensis TaxID=882444 RepID=UPI0037B32002